MSKKVFIVLNIIYFVFDYICIPYINPNGVVFGFIPFQMALYGGMGIVSSVLWGTYFWKFFDSQSRYDDEGNIVTGKGGAAA